MSVTSTNTVSSKTTTPQPTYVYADSEEKYAKSVILYGQTSDDYVYIDAAYTTKIAAADLLAMCLKGAVVLYGGAYYTPISFKEDEGVVSLVIATSISASTSTANTVVTLNSEEYTQE